MNASVHKKRTENYRGKQERKLRKNKQLSSPPSPQQQQQWQEIRWLQYPQWGFFNHTIADMIQLLLEHLYVHPTHVYAHPNRKYQ